MTTSQALRGVIAPILTPYNDDGSVALDLYVENAHRLLKDGCVGLAPFGTTGEALSVGIAERMHVLEELVEAGIPAERLIPGTGLTNLVDTTSLTRHAVELGCAGAMTLPPFYFKGVSDDGLFTYFTRLIDMVADERLNIYLYHIPQVAGVGIPPAVVRRLHQKFPETVIGIKDSSGDWENTKALLEIDGLIVYPGSELPIIEAIELGAPGCISATANLNAAAIAEVIELMHQGQTAEARSKHEQVKKFRLTVQGYAPIPAQKRILALWSGDNRWANVRPPLESMSREEGQRLADTLESEHGLSAASVAA